MKFDYYLETSEHDFYPWYHFKFSLPVDEVRQFQHMYGRSNLNWVPDVYSSICTIHNALIEEKVDLGINYKQKYEEIEELLRPYKIADDMTPLTTLKMILKYGKPDEI